MERLNIYAMNKSQKSEISSFLEKFRKQRALVSKARSELEKILSDRTALMAKIEKIGEPDYNDDKAINNLNALQIKLRAIGSAETKADLKIGKELEQLAPMIQPGCALAIEVLRPAVESRKAIIVSAVRMFSLTDSSAQWAASSTDAWAGAERRIAHYARMTRDFIDAHIQLEFAERYMGNEQTIEDYHRLLAGGVDIFERVSDEIEAVLAEAVSTSPDLLKFLPFEAANPSSLATAATEKLQEASVATNVDGEEALKS
jgi:hypothetical protein